MSTETISQYLQTAYDDQHLAALLAHAEDGKLSYLSCCCLAHFPTAKHAAKGENSGEIDHFLAREHLPKLPNYNEADTAFCALGHSDELRRTRLVPLIRAEMARRESLATHNVPANTWENNVTGELAGVLTR